MSLLFLSFGGGSKYPMQALNRVVQVQSLSFDRLKLSRHVITIAYMTIT